MMDSLFRNLINQGKIVVYMDDILLFSKTLEEHVGIVKEVLEILNNNKLLIQTKKNADSTKQKLNIWELSSQRIE